MNTAFPSQSRRLLKQLHLISPSPPPNTSLPVDTLHDHGGTSRPFAISFVAELVTMIVFDLFRSLLDCLGGWAVRSSAETRGPRPQLHTYEGGSARQLRRLRGGRRRLRHLPARVPRGRDDRGAAGVQTSVSQGVPGLVASACERRLLVDVPHLPDSGGRRRWETG